MFFHIAAYFHEFDLNQGQICNEFNNVHFLTLDWRQLFRHQFHIYANHAFFHIAVHFHQFHMNQGRICNEFNNVYFLILDWRQLLFHCQSLERVVAVDSEWGDVVVIKSWIELCWFTFNLTLSCCFTGRSDDSDRMLRWSNRLSDQFAANSPSLRMTATIPHRVPLLQVSRLSKSAFGQLSVFQTDWRLDQIRLHRHAQRIAARGHSSALLDTFEHYAPNSKLMVDSDSTSLYIVQSPKVLNHILSCLVRGMGIQHFWVWFFTSHCQRSPDSHMSQIHTRRVYSSRTSCGTSCNVVTELKWWKCKRVNLFQSWIKFNWIGETNARDEKIICKGFQHFVKSKLIEKRTWNYIKFNLSQSWMWFRWNWWQWLI
jgi:hypothetical protein